MNAGFVKVSVIIPTFGEPRFLKRAIQSVLSQSLEAIELIIVDDNDPASDARKKTEAIVSSFETIIYIKHPRNLNGATARNTGISYARGEYIAFLDADDEYDEKRLEVCYNAIVSSGQDFGGVYTGCIFYRSGKYYKRYLNVSSGNHLIETLACSFKFCSGSNIFVKASIIKELGGFDESFQRHQDYEFLVRFFEKYSILAIKQPLLLKNDELINLPNVERIIQIKKQYLSKYQYIIDSLSKRKQRFIYGAHYYSICQLALEEGDKDNYNCYFKKCGNQGQLSFLRRVKLLLLRLKYSGKAHKGKK